jgi:ribosomal protein S18 acetylase RimI-like enzyme
MGPHETIWVRHVWDLEGLEIRLVAPQGYDFDSASTSEEQQIVHVVLSAYASDPVWKPMMNGISNRMTERIATTLGAANSDYIVARTEAKIVAASGVAEKHWTDQNLLTGICVLPEHQRKGIGRHLLSLSLLRLKQMGLRRAQVYTESDSLADRKIYPLFGSRREEGVPYPGFDHG